MSTLKKLLKIALIGGVLVLCVPVFSYIVVYVTCVLMAQCGIGI